MRRAWAGAAGLVLALSWGRASLAQTDKAVQRSVRAATLVVEAEAAKFFRPSSDAEVTIRKDLKGASTTDRIRVSFDRAPAGLWPKLGERRVLCLAETGSGRYELASFSAAVLPVADDVLALVREAAVAVAVSTPPEAGAVVDTTPAEKPKGVLEARAAMAETVLVGTLSNVTGAPGGAVGMLQVEKALMGYGSYPEPVTVQFPPASGVPEAGRYALFLRSRRTDGGFSVVSASWGVVALADDDAEKTMAAEFAEFGASTSKLTSIPAVLAEWQTAWNAKDLARCIRCYSPENKLSRQFYAAGDARVKLEEQLKAFKGTVELKIQRIQTARAPIPQATAGAEVTVLLSITVPDGKVDRRTALMVFVSQGGEWMILEEGF
jgi:ketosteroid isomerase-like protein